MTVPATANPVHGKPRRAARPGFWVIPHEPVCPECGSSDVSVDEVDTGDGIEETAYICEPCGCAWPLACICEWSTREGPAKPASASAPELPPSFCPWCHSYPCRCQRRPAVEVD